MSLTAPSSSVATVVPFPPAADRPPFAVATKTWLKTTTADRLLTADEARLCTALYQHFNREHYEKTGELIARPSWQTLMAWSTLSKTAVHNGIDKLERLRCRSASRELSPTRRDTNSAPFTRDKFPAEAPMEQSMDVWIES